MSTTVPVQTECPIVSFKWKDYDVVVYTLNIDDGFEFSAIDYCGEQWNNRMGGREETELYEFTIQYLKQLDMT